MKASVFIKFGGDDRIVTIGNEKFGVTADAGQQSGGFGRRRYFVFGKIQDRFDLGVKGDAGFNKRGGMQNWNFTVEISEEGLTALGQFKKAQSQRSLEAAEWLFAHEFCEQVDIENFKFLNQS